MTPTRLRGVLNGLLSIVYPGFCKICGEFVTDTQHASICQACWDGILPIADPICDICGLPLPNRPWEGMAPRRCGECLFDTYPFAGARAVAYYEGSLREIIHLFKFGLQKNLARPLAERLYRTYQKHSATLAADMIVAVPLHPDRLRERGFNQSELLGKRLARQIGIPFGADVLARIRATPPQSGLHKKARARNVRRAFTAPHPERVRGKRILLVDDVFTTGATLAECTRTLRDAGAQAIYILTVARVLSN